MNGYYRYVNTKSYATQKTLSFRGDLDLLNRNVRWFVIHEEELENMLNAPTTKEIK